MGRFVRPDTKILHISNGDTLTVRCRLTAGEQRARFARMSLAGLDGALSVNRLQVGLSTITAYLLDWTLTDDDGKPVVIRDASPDELTAVVDGLDVPSFNEILKAIEAHEAAMETAAKNGQGDASALSAISPSPSGAIGVMNGSLS